MQHIKLNWSTEKDKDHTGQIIILIKINDFYSLKPFVITNFNHFYKQYFSAMDWINMAEQN